MRLRFTGGVEGYQPQIAEQRLEQSITGGRLQSGLAQHLAATLGVELPQLRFERRRQAEKFETTRAERFALGWRRLRARILNIAIDDDQSRLAREKSEARKSLQLLWRQIELPQRPTFFQPSGALGQGCALEVDRPFFLFQAFEATFDLIVICKYQLALDSLDRGLERYRGATEFRHDEQQRVEVANEWQETRIERRALFLLFGIRREIQQRQFDLHLLFRTVGRFQKIQPGIHHFNLSRSRAISRVRLTLGWRQTRQRMKNRGFADPARPDDAALHSNLRLPLGCHKARTSVTAIGLTNRHALTGRASDKLSAVKEVRC